MGRKKRTVQKRYLRRRKWAAVLVALVLLGRAGQLPYARWGRELAKDFTALPGTGRLLLWGGTALWALWEEEIRPFAAGLWH